MSFKLYPNGIDGHLKNGLRGTKSLNESKEMDLNLTHIFYAILELNKPFFDVHGIDFQT
jgi:hypothetical protein